MRTVRTSLGFLLLMAVTQYVGAAEHLVASPSQDLPIAARSRISAALARDLPGYYAQSVGHSLEATNSQQKLVTRFGSQGVDVRNGSSHWGMALQAYGHGDLLQPVKPVAPQASLNRVEYRRDFLTEWYVNGPVGLEQGFTFSQAPKPPTARPLTIALTLSGDLKAVVDESKASLTLTDFQEQAKLQYAGLSARDAAGKLLHAWLEMQGQQLLLKVEDRNARYPVVIDPVLKQAKLIASDGHSQDELGASMAISGDTVVVGSPNAKVGNNKLQGAAYVFVKPATGWANMKQNAKLTASDGGVGENFGWSVAISGGNIVVGAPFQTDVNSQGAAYYFVKPIPMGWVGNLTEASRLTATSPEDNAYFGTSVAVRGRDVVVGAPGAQLNGNQSQGDIETFSCTFDGHTCVRHFRLWVTDGAAFDYFGAAVAFSGTTIAVGMPFATVGSNAEQGAVWAITYKSPCCAAAKLTASDGASLDQLGASVAASGNTIVAGAPYGSAFATKGAAYVFVEPAKGWVKGTQTAKLTASDGRGGDEFGYSVAISGKLILCGAPQRENINNPQQGAVYSFTQPLGGWTDMTQTRILLAHHGATFDAFGWSVGVSGSTRGGGAIGGKVNGNAQGAVYLFTP